MDQINHSAWAGRRLRDEGCVTQSIARQFEATLGGTADVSFGDPMPLLSHWCAFPTTTLTDDLGEDGHPRGSDLLPPSHLRRRMWAGGSLEFHAPLCVGDPLRRQSSVRSVTHKEGAAGEMMFVTVDHAIYGPRGLAIEERQDIVYLNIPEIYQPPKTRALAGDIIASCPATPTMLFRYSALTFNAHRIHYDQTYATEVEKYPGLVVHGPLQATALIRAASAQKGQPPKMFDFRGVHPMFAADSFDIHAQDDIHAMTLTTGQGGHVCMQASAVWMGTL